jgi:hypothetical protein
VTILAPAPSAAVRRVPWTRLSWVTWRRYRFIMSSSVGVIAVLAFFLIRSGRHARAAYHAVAACTPDTSAQCRFLDEQFRDKYTSTGFLGPILLLLPGLLGVFAGAPLLAKEFESGTFRYAWTQGVGRMRWAVTILVPGAIGLAVLLGGFGILNNWHEQPLVAYGSLSRLEAQNFAITGLAVAGWAMLGFSLGVVAGLLWRRVVPAIASAFAVWFGLAYAAATIFRPHYMAPKHTTATQTSGRDLYLDHWWTKNGVRVPEVDVNSILQSLGAEVGSGNVKVHIEPGGVDPIQALMQQGYAQVTEYQPAGRYWTFQWIEFGWLTALSVILLAVAFRLLRRRAF